MSKTARLEMNRRKFLHFFSAVGLGSTMLPGTLTAVAQDKDEITVEMVETAEKLAGLSFPPEMRERFARELTGLRDTYKEISDMNMDSTVAPCIVFNPMPSGAEEIEPERRPVVTSSIKISRPVSDDELAFLPVTHMSQLIKTQKITATELTNIYITRLKKYNPILNCAITITEKLAETQALKADEEIAAGNYRGPLHGIPYGLKDLIAVKGYKTTWGAEPYKDQIVNVDATVFKRLTKAGAIHIAKLATGALASASSYWFGGETKNPWNTEQGAGGSSGGPGSATAAGLVGFSLGTETQGSIIGPSSRCGITGFRPTFGLVSKYGVMPLSWTMDKVGPMCRSAEDCAIVLNSIYGPDGYDMSVTDREFNWDPNLDIRRLNVVYVEPVTGESRRGNSEASIKLFNDSLDVIRSLGVDLKKFSMPESVSGKNLGFILHTEGAAMFDHIIRDSSIDTMKHNSGRPYRFRARRFVPGSEYINANRARTVLMQEMYKALKGIDIIIGGSTGSTNHTGHPAMTLVNGFTDGMPSSMRIQGNLYKDAEMLALARAYQSATGFHLKHPALP
ncbi:amidase [candidate division KSB1 bacterium]